MYFVLLLLAAKLGKIRTYSPEAPPLAVPSVLKNVLGFGISGIEACLSAYWIDLLV